MVEISEYVKAALAALKGEFGDRLLYLGLQGSYGRGEAEEGSDVDLFVVLDRLEPADMAAYRKLLPALPAGAPSCGFLAGRAELMHWNPCELCQLLHETVDCYGELAAFLPAYTRADIVCYVKLTLGNLYHELVHRRVHAPAEEAGALPATYRQVFYILQNLHYLRSGNYLRTKKELLAALSGRDRAVLARAVALKRGECFPVEESFALLFAWCQETLAKELLAPSR